MSRGTSDQSQQRLEEAETDRDEAKDDVRVRVERLTQTLGHSRVRVDQELTADEWIRNTREDRMTSNLRGYLEFQ